MTTQQAAVLNALRAARRGHSGEPVPVHEIVEHARDSGVSYDTVFRALRALVAAGFVVRPKRGHYDLAPRA